MSNITLRCQQNYCRQISGHQRGCRKSIICQHSTRPFRVVNNCTQTDKRPSWSYKGGTELKAWSGVENKGSLQLATSLFKMLPEWSGKQHNMNSDGRVWRFTICILQQEEKLYCTIVSFYLSLSSFSLAPSQLTDPVPPRFQWPWRVTGHLRLVFYWKRDKSEVRACYNSCPFTFLP